MAKSERCPICNVPVKPENLLRHLDENHPRHPEAAALREKLREDIRRAPPRRPRRGIRLKRTHVAAVAIVVLIGAGLYVAAPFFDPYYGFNRDTCIREEDVQVHLHPWLAVVIDGSLQSIPPDAGHQPCLKPLHTHDGATGYPGGETDPQYGRKIHVESPKQITFTLGDFFAVWGQTLTPNEVLGCGSSTGQVVSMTVNGQPSSAFGSLVLEDGQLIRITCA